MEVNEKATTRYGLVDKVDTRITLIWQAGNVTLSSEVPKIGLHKMAQELVDLVRSEPYILSDLGLSTKAATVETTGFLCPCGHFHLPGQRDDHRSDFHTHQTLPNVDILKHKARIIKQGVIEFPTTDLTVSRE